MYMFTTVVESPIYDVSFFFFYFTSRQRALKMADFLISDLTTELRI